MALLLRKFQKAVKSIAKNPRQLQFEADTNRLFLYTSYNLLGKNATEADAEEIIDMASRASVDDQQKLVQENVHSQMKIFCDSMNKVLLPDKKTIEPLNQSKSNSASRGTGLSFAVGRSSPPADCHAVPETRPLKRAELSKRLKDHIGYTLDLKPSLIPHKEAGRGLFLDGEAEVGSVVAVYPGLIYSPAYYRFIPGYPRVDAQNPYLITRYDGNVINAQPWGSGGETREHWNGLTIPDATLPNTGNGGNGGSDRLWKALSKPLEALKYGGRIGEVLELRNPLALAHFANHPGKGAEPNVMICPYDFPLTEEAMRAYIPNVTFGNEEEAGMRRFGSFWFKSFSSKSNAQNDVPILRTLVLVATRALCDEELLLNYRLSNAKRRPSWYAPVDEEEDKRRWS